MRVTVLNTEEELKSFPLTQSIKLSIDSVIEDKNLDDVIFLIRNINKQGLFNYSERYNQSIGYIKEKFDPENIKVQVTSKEVDKTLITITPLTPLTPGFEYTLIVNRLLSPPFITVDKPISKSKSNITISTPYREGFNLKLDIISDPLLTPTSNIVKVIVTNLDSDTKVQKILDLKKDKTLKIDNLYTFTFNSEVYVKDEQFTFTSKGISKDSDDFFLQLKASITESIKPIDTNNTRVSLEDLFKLKQESVVTNKEPSLSVEYLNQSVFKLQLKDITVKELDLDKVKYSIKEAFGMYTLSSFGLYDPTNKYTLSIEVLSDTEILFTVT